MTSGEALGLLLILLLNSAPSLCSPEYYTAAVLEHIQNDDPRDRPAAISRNLDIFESAAREASSQGANIIVFPEVAIMPLENMTQSSRKEFFETVPDPKLFSSNPCEMEPSLAVGNKAAQHPVLTRLSCIAKNYKIYLVVNVGEKEHCSPQNDNRCHTDVQTLFYNTNVVLDSNGTLVARHRKRFPYFEPYTTRPRSPEYTVFNTSFGSFGVIICFDSFFKEAVDLVEHFNVDNVVVSAMWFDELPFVSAVQFYQAWALGNKVNVLLANIHNPAAGNTGSLIASGVSGALNYTFEPTLNKSKLVLARVPRSLSHHDEIRLPTTPTAIGDYKAHNLYTKNYTLKRLEGISGSVEACNEGLCCKLEYTSNSEPENFYLGAFNGVVYVENQFSFCQEVCMLAHCKKGSSCTSFETHSDVTFDYVSLTGNIQTPYQYPGVLASEMMLVPYANWDFSPGNVTFQSGRVSVPLLSVSIHGRCYDRDPPYSES